MSDASSRGPTADRQGRGAARIATLLVVPLLFLAGCTRIEQARDATAPPTDASRPGTVNAKTSDAVPKLGGSIVYGLPKETNSFNPALAQWVSYSMIEARTFFDFLTEYGADGEVHPSLATSMTHNADFTAWTFTLPAGITFSNGKPLDAGAMVRLQTFMKASPVLGSTYQLVERWDIVDDLTFTVHMNRPWAAFPAAMAAQPGAIGEPQWLVDNTVIPVGSGPYIVDEWKVADQMVVKKNPNYWRKDVRGTPYPYLDQITFKIITDDDARVAALRSGELDIMLQTLTGPIVGDLRAEAAAGTFQLFTDEGLEMPEDEVTLNTTKPPFDDLDARLALAAATDQAAYREAITGGLGEPASSAFAPGSRWYNDIDFPGYDLARAKELVDKVKAKTGGSFTFELLASNSPEEAHVQQHLQEQWAKAGITATLKSQDQQGKVILSVAGNFQAVLQQNFDHADPSNDCIFWLQDQVPNPTFSLTFSRLRDAEMTQACYDAMGTTDRAVQREELGVVQRRIAALVPYVWLGHAPHNVVASPKLMNVTNYTLPDGTAGLPLAQGAHPLFQVWIAA